MQACLSAGRKRGKLSGVNPVDEAGKQLRCEETLENFLGWIGRKAPPPASDKPYLWRARGYFPANQWSLVKNLHGKPRPKQVTGMSRVRGKLRVVEGSQMSTLGNQYIISLGITPTAAAFQPLLLVSLGTLELH